MGLSFSRFAHQAQLYRIGPFLWASSEVSVTDPAKMGNGVQAYISYKVIAKTNLPEYQAQEKIVIRRYSDFVWLRDRLFEKYKGIFIPPLPEKNTVEKFRFSAEFIEMRRQALDIFINRVASHNGLRQSEDLRIFLQADEQPIGVAALEPTFRLPYLPVVEAQRNFEVLTLFGASPPVASSGARRHHFSVSSDPCHSQQLRCSTTRSLSSPVSIAPLPHLVRTQTMDRARSQETGLFKKKPADLIQIFWDVQSKVSDVVLGKEKPVEESNPEYEKLKHYIFELEDHLAEAQKHAYSLVKRHRELGESLSNFGKAVKLLGTSEDNALGKAFSELGAKSELISIKLQKEAHYLLMNFEEPLKDYVRAVQSIKATIAERANAFRQQCELAETIKFKEIDLNKLRLTRSEKLAEAEREYEVLKAEGEEAAQRFQTIVRLMNEEIVQFQEQKTLEMGLAFHEFAKGQARLANGISEAWRGLLPKLEACS
nr:sorting nexin 1-like isoform X3 [Ipomoea trifida]